MKYTKANNTYFAKPKDDPKDRIEVEVGDSKQPDFYPQVKIMRWDNEVNFSARLVHDEKSPKVSKQGEKIKWVGDKIEVNTYALTEDEGGYEFEVILKEKPKTNVIEFSFNTKGLDFFYQPFLKNQNEDGFCWEENETGKSECPENVCGSYAVYTSENKVNYVGGKEYKCGKVGHIYRPQIEDAEGIKAWGELKVDIEKGILSVTIPQDFLDKAVYPVRHAAGLTFGYTSTPATTSLQSGGYIKASGIVYAGEGEVTKMSYYGKAYSGTTNIQMAIYDTSSPSAKLTNGSTNSVSINTTPGWWDATFSTNPTTAAVNYYLAHNSQGDRILYYDTVATASKNKSSAFNTWPSTITWGNDGTREYGIYATYTASGGGETAKIPSLFLLGVG